MIEFNGIFIDELKLNRNYLYSPLQKGEYPSEAELLYLYIDLNMTQRELGEFLGKNKIDRYLRKIGVQKSKEQQLESAKRYNLRIYGASSPLQSEQIQQKIKQTNLEKYGVTCTFQSEEIKAKIKQSNLKKYGCENVAQSQCVKAKINSVSRNQDEIQNKIKITNLERYGCENPFGNENIQQKIKQTNLEKYGCENPMQNNTILNKVRTTNLERYGAEYAAQSEEIKAKIKQTNLERYGCECSLQNDQVKEKSKLTNLKKYGTFSSAQKNISAEALKILACKETLEQFILAEENRTAAYLASKLDFCVTGFRKYCHQYDLWDLIDHQTSVPEVELQSLFPFMRKTRSVIAPYEIDLYSEEHKFGIEFNGNYWHSEQHGMDKNYHQKKSLLAKDKGIFLYHIWEHEWNNEVSHSIIISQLRNNLGLNKNRIYARKCQIKEIHIDQLKVFLDENHLQGYCPSKINLGLFYQNELVSAMTFGKPRFDKKYEYELLRFCNKKNTSVIGGASKLFKHFIKEYNPNNILSYSHIDKGTGKLYENLGFSLKNISDPGYVWCNDKKVLSRYQCQKYRLLQQGFEGNSEREIMENRGFSRVYDCGNYVYTLEFNS